MALMAWAPWLALVAGTGIALWVLKWVLDLNPEEPKVRLRPYNPVTRKLGEGREVPLVDGCGIWETGDIENPEKDVTIDEDFMIKGPDGPEYLFYETDGDLFLPNPGERDARIDAAAVARARNSRAKSNWRVNRDDGLAEVMKRYGGWAIGAAYFAIAGIVIWLIISTLAGA